MSTSAARLRSAHDAALHWLLHSEVRSPDGWYRSIYDTRRRAYANFYPMDVCMLCTAGAVVVLGRAGHAELAAQSAERVCELAVADGGDFQGAILAGRGTSRVLSNWIAFAVFALLEEYARSGRELLLTVARRAGDFVIEHMQGGDGSVRHELRRGSRGNTLRRLLLPVHTWPAPCVEAFLALERATGEPRYRAAAERLSGWLAGLQRAEGWLPMYRHGLLSRVVAGLREASPAELLAGCRVAHPASNSQTMKALMLTGRVEEARRIARWLSGQLGPNGLLYQFYYARGGHCVEEDVMPTAHFGLVAMEHPELGVEEAALERIADGIAYARIRSDDPNADGGMRGLPLQPESGENAYTWDTMFGVLFLRAWLERGARVA